jgi:hypothetical protein
VICRLYSVNTGKQPRENSQLTGATIADRVSFSLTSLTSFASFDSFNSLASLASLVLDLLLGVGASNADLHPIAISSSVKKFRIACPLRNFLAASSYALAAS